MRRRPRHTSKKAFGEELAFKLDYGILRGDGAGKPLGIIGAPATIVVPKDVGQPSATITPSNIDSMWSRLAAPCRARATWLVNEDMEGLIDQMVVAVGTAGSAAPTDFIYPHENPGPPLLKGRPICRIEQAPPIGQVGDIVLADLSQYLILDGGETQSISVHAQFVNYQTVLRFVLRIDGSPARTTPVTPYNSTNTRSAFVTLAAR